MVVLEAVSTPGGPLSVKGRLVTIDVKNVIHRKLNWIMCPLFLTVGAEAIIAGKKYDK
jgi:hypothetical protein